MTRRLRNTALASILFAGALLAVAVAVEAQQQKKIPRIGFLTGTSPSSNSVRAETFRQGLRQLGYAEGKDIVIEFRHADVKLDRLNELAAEFGPPQSRRNCHGWSDRDTRPPKRQRPRSPLS